MGRHRARHSNGIFIVFQTILRFILNGFTGVFFVHIGCHATALNHKVFNHTMENHTIIKTVFHILFKISSRNRGFFVIQLNANHAFICG